MAVIVCSATDRALASGVLTTTIPRSVAALTSIVSTPTPWRPMTLRAVGRLDDLPREGGHPDDDALHPFYLFDDRRRRRIGGHADIEAVVEHLTPLSWIGWTIRIFFFMVFTSFSLSTGPRPSPG